jgi:hypothetical protein
MEPTWEERCHNVYADRIPLGMLAAAAASLMGGAAFGLAAGPILGQHWGVHLLLSAVGGAVLVYLVDASTWARQLAAPGAVGVALYRFFHDGRTDAWVCVALVIPAMVALGTAESHIAVGRVSAWWRSFLLHPLAWHREFGIQTFESIAVPPSVTAEHTCAPPPESPRAQNAPDR